LGASLTLVLASIGSGQTRLTGLGGHFDTRGNNCAVISVRGAIIGEARHGACPDLIVGVCFNMADGSFSMIPNTTSHVATRRIDLHAHATLGRNNGGKPVVSGEIELADAVSSHRGNLSASNNTAGLSVGMLRVMRGVHAGPSSVTTTMTYSFKTYKNKQLCKYTVRLTLKQDTKTGAIIGIQAEK